MSPKQVSVAVSSSGRCRLQWAEQWLLRRAPSEEILIVGASRHSADDVARRTAMAVGAVFGWHRFSLPQLAAAIAAPGLARRGLAPLGRLGTLAIVTRVVHRLRAQDRLGRYRAIADTPGLPRALASLVSELRLAGVGPGALRDVAPDLATMLEVYGDELAGADLTDWPGLIAVATDVVRTRSAASPHVGRPILLLDVPIASEVESDFVAALADAAPEFVATVPAGDAATVERLEGHLLLRVEALDARLSLGDEHGGALRRLQRNLFREDGPPTETSALDDVGIFSAPGEGLECVEIARRVLRLARGGTPLDRIAVLLRSVGEYRSHVEEAFARAAIPAHFARGAVRPDPAGRAFCALLRCAAQGLSAQRFAEYLSLGQVPDATEAGEPPRAAPSGNRWIGPEPDDRSGTDDVGEPLPAAPVGGHPGDAHGASVRDGQLRAPRRWEKLLVEAAVIGGRERWQRRLDGLEQALRLAVSRQDDDEARSAHLRRSLDDLAAFAGFALPLIGDLDDLPRTEVWGVWLDRLGALATRSLRRSDRVLAILGELAPLGPVGPVALDEVLRTLEPLLVEAAAPSSGPVYGRVFVAPVDAARGLSFDAVFVPGLGERMFPSRIGEDPILLDALREQLPGRLPTNQARLERERLALALASGAAEERICFSYPRLDLQQGRPRVPSFYALETVRAAEGRLPDFGELAARAETGVVPRIGWPAPSGPADAIDDAEYDLSLLAGVAGGIARTGAARYLVGANVHLARALRARHRRWSHRWTVADGLLGASPLADGVMALHSLRARSYSPTALEHYAACPYRFFLKAIHRLAPSEVPAAIEQLDPIQRGSLIHACQFGVLARLRDGDLLPLRRSGLREAGAILDETLATTAARYEDELAPAIQRVWEDGIAAIRSDLREWLRLLSEDGSGFVPWRFELAFGLGRDGRVQADPRSVPDAVDLACGVRLRGSIDVVERHPSGLVRVTDHKTGLADVRKGQVVSGGTVLQPLLYALAAERLFDGCGVTGGRLSFCTSRGGFSEQLVQLDEESRSIAGEVARAVGGAVEASFLPAFPAPGACERCDYRPVCGPHEAIRTAGKPRAAVEALLALRNLP